jgi:hypothetical protein
MLSQSEKLKIFDGEEIGPMEKALTKEIVESLKLINQIHLKSAVHLISGNIIITRCSMDNPDNIIRMCEKLVLQVGVSCFVYALPEDTISDTTISCGLTTKADLISLINETGVRRFLKEKITTEILKDYCSAMGKNFDNAFNPSEMVDYVSDEIMLYGMENWLDQFPRKLLEDWCNSLTIDVLSHESDAALIDSIMVKIFNLRKQEPETAKSNLNRSGSELVEEVSKSEETETIKTPKKKRKKSEKSKGKEPDGDGEKQNAKDEEVERKPKKKRSAKDTTEYSHGSDFSDDTKKKKSRKASSTSLVLSEITKHTTKEDLTAYILKDLQQYCRENSISYIGRKSELISRIITFLETGEKPHKRKYTKRKRLGSKHVIWHYI